MKNLSILFLLMISISFSACDKRDTEIETPYCIENKICEFDQNYCEEEGVSVKMYSFQNKMVYVFDTGTRGADKTSEVIDEYCNSLGFLGGISGNFVINGEDFSFAEFEGIIWER